MDVSLHYTEGMRAYVVAENAEGKETSGPLFRFISFWNRGKESVQQEK